MPSTRPGLTILRLMIVTAVVAVVLSVVLWLQDMTVYQRQALILIGPIVLYVGLRMLVLRVARPEHRAGPAGPVRDKPGTTRDGPSRGSNNGSAGPH